MPSVAVAWVRWHYGYNRWQTDVMISTVVAIIVIVQIIQLIGDILSRLVDHRAR